jgi:acetyl-CoA acetyltransferase
MHVLHSYSVWLAMWTVLAALGLQYPPPPTMSMLAASVFTTITALVLPQFNIYVGMGSGQLSLRVAVTTIEIGLAMLALYTSNKNSNNNLNNGTSSDMMDDMMGDMMDESSIMLQMVVSATYVAYMAICGISPVDHYMRVLPQHATNRTLGQFVRHIRTRSQ